MLVYQLLLSSLPNSRGSYISFPECHRSRGIFSPCFPPHHCSLSLLKYINVPTVTDFDRHEKN